MKLLKYNEHIHYLTDEEDSDYDPNEILELVGLPSGLYMTMFRKEYSLRLKEIITWSENLKMYTYRDKDYSKIMYIIDKGMPRSEEPKFKPVIPSINQTNQSFNLTVTSTSAVITFLNRWNIKDYVLDKHNKVSVNGDVIIRYESFPYLPVVFEDVTGDFTIRQCAIETLENCPKYVGGNFNVSNNRLRTLIGGPEKIGKNYDCSSNYLKDLKGSPIRVIDFICRNNNLNTLKGSPFYIEGDFDCSHNFITTFKDGPLSCKGHLNCQDNIIQDMNHVPFLVKSINIKNNPINDKH